MGTGAGEPGWWWGQGIPSRSGGEAEGVGELGKDLRLGMTGQWGRRRVIQRPTWAGEPGDQKPGWEA